jgi:putative ABC transport system substrate-binding protein
MERRAFLAVIAGGALAAPQAVKAQQQGKVWRVGLLDYAGADPAGAARWTAFRERLRELGYVEGQNVVFEPRWGEGQVGRLPNLFAELINAKIDIIVTAGSESALAAKRATSSIPIVTATGSDPVELGLVASLAGPGGNITGVASIARQLSGKRLELLKQLIPRASRVSILWDPDNRASALSVRETEAAAKTLGIELQSVGVRGSREFDDAFSAMKRDRVFAVILVSAVSRLGDRRRIADLAVKHRLPMMVGAESTRRPER